MKNRALLLVLVVTTPFLSGCFGGGSASDWAYAMTGFRQAGGFTGSGIKIAIVDTGIDGEHPSLDHTTIIWRDEINGQNEPYDDVGHGSHVAGIIVGKGSSFGGGLQGYNLKGAAQDTDLIVVKAIRAEDGKGPTSAVANGITFAVQNNADVICLSLGSDPNALDLLPNDIQGAVNTAINRGILVVASAGNLQESSDGEAVKVPANIELVVAVGAVDEDKRLASFSARGGEDRNQGPFGTGLGGRPDPHKKPEVVAPGVKIKSAWKDGGYAIASGTSQAAPFVCSAFALLLEKCPALRSVNSADMVRGVKTNLMKSAQPIPGQRTPHDNGAGYGLLSANKLLDLYGANC